MSRPLFTVVIPTIGRETLHKTLDSIREQGPPSAIESIVVADAFEMEPSKLEEIRIEAKLYGARFLGLDAGRHDTGSPQLAHGYEHAGGQWIVNLGDDDIYEPHAFATMRRAIENDLTIRPLMFRTVLHPAPHRGNELPVVLWHQPGLVRGLVTGQNICVPNVPEKLGRWVDDFTFMTETVAAWDGLAAWRTEVVSQCY